MTIADVDVLSLFEEEATERLARFGDLLLKLETQGPDPDLVASLFREAHTLKGAAVVVGLEEVAAEAHALEEVLDAVRSGSEEVTPPLIDILFAGLDRLLERTGVAAARPVRGVPGAALMQSSTPRWSLAPSGAPLDDAVRGETARVAVDRLDELVRLAGESAAAHLRIAELVRDHMGMDPYAVPEMRALSRLLTDLQDRTLRVRMLPVAALAGPLRRAARDLARRTGKAVRCEVRGEDTELDRHVHERLADALMHLVRNAVDHGIESPEQRRAAGKPEEGSIVVHAMPLGSRVIVTVSDDGSGIDIAAVRHAATRLGIDTRGLEEEEILELLFRPGLSTMSRVTDVSGRGVGLDAVREGLEPLRGRVEVSSHPGAGTMFRISVPITLTLLHGLLVEAGGRSFAMALSNVAAVLPSDTREEMVEGRPAVRVGDQVVPITPLAAVLGEAMASVGPVVVVTGLSRTHVLRVDRLIGQRDVLVKAMPSLVPAPDLVVGASAEPDGTVLLVLDSEAVVDAAGGVIVPTSVFMSYGRENDGPSEVDDDALAPRWRVLVVDDALTVRELQRSILERAGYDVTTAVDGHDALQKMDDVGTDLVLTDLEMPIVDGFQLTRAIRSHPRHSNLPIVVLTSRTSEEDRREGMEAGADAYVLKANFDEAAILRIVDGLLGRVRA